jgi:hypothetical protein
MRTGDEIYVTDDKQGKTFRGKHGRLKSLIIKFISIDDKKRICEIETAHITGKFNSSLRT